MGYRGRPGISPVAATLLATHLLRPGDLTLDLGCGDGTEALALASRGVPTVGVDWYGVSRAQEEARLLGLEPMTWFLRASLTHLSRLFEPATFDAAIDMLAYNNLLARQGWKGADRYVREVARVLRPGALYTIAWREDPIRRDIGPDELDRALPYSFFDLFDAGEPVFTHLPTRPTRAGDRGYASVGLVVAWRRG